MSRRKPSVNVPMNIGELDSQEISFICKKKALDLVLIEQASEQVSELLSEDITNNLLTAVVKATCDEKRCSTMPYVVFPVNEDDPKYTEYPDYKKAVSTFKKQLSATESKLVYTLICASEVDEKGVENGGSHYASVIIYKRKNIAELHDSMQAQTSPYTSAFSTFLIKAGLDPHTPQCIIEDLVPQYTGGFVTGVPYWLDSCDPKYQTDLRVQSTDSQNHFCYVWSIWYIHLILLGYDFPTIIKVVQFLNPLIIIKRYIWYLLIYIDWMKDIPDIEFFKRHFPCYWNVYKCEFKGRWNANFVNKRPSSFKDCFDWSISLPDMSVQESLTDPKETLSLVKCVDRNKSSLQSLKVKE